MQILKAGLLYFALVFGAGFVLGAIRTLWVVPRYGTRNAELMEMPIMFVVIIVAARWIVLRLAVPSRPSSRLSMGCIAFGLLVLAEFALVLRLRGISVSEYLATRDPMSGTVYFRACQRDAFHPAKRTDADVHLSRRQRAKSSPPMNKLPKSILLRRANQRGR